MSPPVCETRAMIAGMNPVLDDAEYVFCAMADPAGAEAAKAVAIAFIREDEGLSLVLPASVARELGIAGGPQMQRIVLSIHSALDGVGLTAAVSGSLAQAGIACNVIAGFHHDHLFIPSGDADAALRILLEAQAQAGLDAR